MSRTMNQGHWEQKIGAASAGERIVETEHVEQGTYQVKQVIGHI
ncbi:MAG: hypothetical protein HJJLKODD_00993 [Phycisphaerae bacterium]|nr:hypothetical protein [Phycisphaerae bacterium]